MLRSGLTLLLLAGIASAAVWKEPSGGKTIRSINAASAPGSKAIWDEFGLDQAEEADFGSYKAIAYRFKDPTGAYAGFDWLKSSDRSAALSANFVFTCSGACPAKADWLRFVDPAAVSRVAGPTLPSYLPKKSRVPGSERYILGPASLAEFAPGLPVSAVAFQFSTEAVVARYQDGNASSLLAVLSYPTPSMARQQTLQFQKLSGSVVKRSGSLVIVIPSPRSPQAAEALLAGISFEAKINWDEKPPDPRFMTKLRQMLWAIGQLILFLVALCVAGGLAVGAAGLLRTRFGTQTASDDVIALHLFDK